jgi:hypothetical protein
LILPVIASAQAIVKGGGVVYTNGAPTHTINVNTDAETAIDTTSGLWYERSRDGAGWIAAGFRVQKLAGSSPPSGAPDDKESEVQLNDVDSLYRWRAGAWQHINKVLVYTAGTGISVTGTVIANTGDLLATNEGTLGVGAGSGTSSTLISNTSGANAVTINAAGILAISESTSSNGGSITLTATEVDGSTSNELQTVANTSDATSHTVTLSNSGGSIQLVEGSNITLTTTGTSGAGIVTIASTGGSGSTDLSYSGASSPVTLNSSSGADVTITAGGIVSLSATSGNITISATEVDGSTTNELQTVANTSDATSHTVTLSNSGGSIQLVEGSNITLTTTGTSGAGIVTIASTGGSGSTDLTFSGASSPVTLNSSSGTDVTFTAGGINSFSASSGNITITATEVDGSTSNELQTYGHAGTTTYTNTLSNGGGSFSITGAGINVVSQTAGAVTITATEVDGSTTNELQTVANTSDATSHTVTLSNSGGSVQLVEGSNITLTTTGTSGAGVVTIAATGGGTTDLAFFRRFQSGYPYQ